MTLEGLNLLIDVFLPRRCLGCKNAIAAGVFCEACTSMIQPVDPNEPEDASIGAAFVYAGLLRDLILSAKFAPDPAKSRLLARFFEANLARAYLQSSQLKRRYDIVSYVPTHWRRRLTRQHEFPAQLALVIARQQNIPMHNCLSSTRLDSPLSKTTSAMQRTLQVKGRYRIDKRLRPSRILLIDDVTTTGATLLEAARTLREAGHDVACFAFAKTLLSGSQTASFE